MAREVRPLDPARFLRSMLAASALLALGMLSLPLVMIGLGALSGCSGVGDACGALGALAFPFVLPLLLIVFGYYVFVLTIRRLRDWGAPRWYVLFPVLGAFVAHPFSPTGLVVCLGCSTALCLAPTSAGTEPEGGAKLPTDHVTALAIALLMLVVLQGWLGTDLFQVDRLVSSLAFLAVLVTVFFWITAAVRGRRNTDAIPTTD